MNSTVKSKSHKKIILITGMHRSGTSAMAGCLFYSGFSFGNHDEKELKLSKKDNLKGHFESHDFVRLSNNILKSINSNWHFSINPIFRKELGGDIDCQYEGNIDYPVDDFNLTFHKNFSEMVIDCKSTIDDHIKEHDYLIIKDPRASIVLPVYIRAMIERNEDYELCIIDMKRNITDISLSLNKRDGIPFDQGEVISKKYRELIDRYKEQTIDHLNGKIVNFIDINYKDLVKNPIDTIKLIENKFNLNIIKNKKIRDKILDFIDPDLKHF